MPLSYVTAMLHVGMDEGRGVAEYAAKENLSPTVMTRNLLDIGDRNRQREEGYGLITFGAGPVRPTQTQRQGHA